MARKKKLGEQPQLETPASASPPSKLTKYQTFATRRVHRSLLNPAPYNPRVIDAGGRRGLRESLKRDGLVETLVWNARTGTLVSGHQRLALLDELEGHLDYELDVAAVDLDPVRERELNVRLNSSSITGSYDMDALDRLVRETEGLSLDGLGFTAYELNTTWPDLRGEAAALHRINDAVAAEAAKIEAMRPPREKPAEGGEPDGEPGDEPVDVVGDDEAEKIDRIKQAKAAYKERARKDDRAAYVAFVFGDADELVRFLRAAGLPDEQAQDGRILADKMGIDLEVVR